MRTKKFSKLGSAISHVLRRRSSSKGSLKEIGNSLSISNIANHNRNNSNSNNQTSQSHVQQLPVAETQIIEDNEAPRPKLHMSRSVEELSKASPTTKVSFFTSSPMSTVKSEKKYREKDDKKKFLARFRSNSLGSPKDDDMLDASQVQKHMKSRKSFSWLETSAGRSSSDLLSPTEVIGSPSISPKTLSMTTNLNESSTSNSGKPKQEGSSQGNDGMQVSKWFVNSFPSLFGSRNPSNLLLDTGMNKTNSDTSTAANNQTPEVELAKQRGQVDCINYSSLTDQEMRKLEGRSDHRPVLGSFLAWI